MTDVLRIARRLGTRKRKHHCHLANGYSSAPNVVETFEAPVLKQRAFRLPIGRTAKVGLGPDALIWVVVGDRAKIEQGIRELHLGEVQVIDADGKKL